jgi:outer membrane protein assembly factor BamE (lipoprotein component of BamABCDE complex)
MKKIVAFVSLVLLTACSTYQESFDCPVGEGVRCASMSTINTKMDKNEIQMEIDQPLKEATYFGSDFRVGGIY